jgi:MerR family transcriptional regulator, light-induced transcriptional regulator
LESVLSEPIQGIAIAIAAVERETGLSKDTLRIWERRYGFPQPLRDPQGERAYPVDQVEKLRLLKRLMDAGHRPGKLVGLDMEALRSLGKDAAGAESTRATLGAPYRQLLEAHDVGGLRRQLQQALLTMGLERFVTDHVAPLNTAVGEAWLRGEISVAQEHVYTEAVQLVLRQAIGSMPEPSGPAPRILMATLPQEPHGLGLLMAEALLSLHGWRCISLGVKVPLEDIVVAANLIRAHIVALSFSGSFPAAQAGASLQELRSRLPARTVIWAGGSSLALQRRMPAGVQPVPDIGLLPGLVDQWRHASDPSTT